MPSFPVEVHPLTGNTRRFLVRRVVYCVFGSNFKLSPLHALDGDRTTLLKRGHDDARQEQYGKSKR
jgi:hypothetical protein